MIPDEAVEAAIQGYREKLRWIDNNAIDPRLEDGIAFRAALEAAVPHLMARAWNEGYDYRRGIMPDGETGNPYKKDEATR